MTTYQIYLEIQPGVGCMAHVPELPGCFQRAGSQEEALSKLQYAIRVYQAWLHNHQEDFEVDDAVTLELVEVIHGFGPFKRGDSAALFAADRQPPTPDEMEKIYLRRASFARDDLLALTRPLPRRIHNWRARSGEMTITEILRHVGNAEKWYLSRLVPPDTLPPEWEFDQQLPIFKFLEMERTIVLDRLRGLNKEELQTVYSPTHWTKHPHEPWTARKVLRRMIEHELEHTEHIRQVLSEWRVQLHARLLAERSLLLQYLIGLDEKTLSEVPVFNNTTVKDLLAHLAAWDEIHTQRAKLTLEGRSDDIDFVTIDEQNAAQLAACKHLSLSQALDFFNRSRAEFLELLSAVSDLDLHRRPGKGVASIAQRAQKRYQHDAVHARDVLRWRKSASIQPETGPQKLLLAGLEAAFAEFLSVESLVRPSERQTLLVCGEWSMKDLVGHLADWNMFGVATFNSWRTGESLQAEFSRGLDAWNHEQVEQRKAVPWEQVWSDLHESHQALMSCVQVFSQDELFSPYPVPWDAELVNPYELAFIYLGHYREHASDVRAALKLPGFPKRLLRY